MINIVIPMAGAGSRFAAAGFSAPKPLIPVHDTPMIKVVIDNLSPNHTPYRMIFIVQKEHAQQYALHAKLPFWSKNCEIVEIDGLTEGAACTVMAARHLIETDEHLMIANSDQYIDYSINAYLEKALAPGLDGLIMTMSANDPKWSFVSKGADGFVNRVAEKEVISNEATVGIYNFRSGIDFVNAAQSMIDRNERVNGEFYVAPVYNQLIGTGSKIATVNVGSEAAGMYGLGTPADLALFLSLPISTQFKSQEKIT